MITSGKDILKIDGTDVVFIGKYMEVYIDQYYFDKGAAEMIGTHFKTIGILNFRTFADEDGNKPNKIKIFNLPMFISTYPSGGFETKKMELNKEGETDYYILKYNYGDKFCDYTNAADSNAFELILNIMLSGHLPATFPYDSIYEMWQRSFEMNGINFDVPDFIKEMIIAQIYRDPKNFRNTFGSVLGKNPKTSVYDYERANQRRLAASQSVFNGIVFENFDGMVISGINSSREGKKENHSPMEDLMKY